MNYQKNPFLNYLTEQVKYLYGWYKEGDDVGKEKKKKINKFDETEIDIGTDNPIYKRLQAICEKINGDKKKEPSDKVGKTDLHVSMVTKVKDNYSKKFTHYVVRIYGGLNGPGKWENYCRDFARLFLMIRNNDMFDHATMCQIDNDCPDDVFTAYISLVLKRKGNDNE